MSGDTLNPKALNFYNFSRIPFFILVGEKIAFFILVITGKPFQCVLIVRIKRNDYIPFGSRAIALDNKQIIFFDTGIDHGIAFCAENVEVSFAEHGDGQAHILFDIFLLLFGRAALNRAYEWGGKIG